MAIKSAHRHPTGNGTAQIIRVEYHVVPHGERWDVERDDRFTGQFAYSPDVAIGLAIASAQREEDPASVCIQQADGTCRHLWP